MAFGKKRWNMKAIAAVLFAVVALASIEYSGLVSGEKGVGGTVAANGQSAPGFLQTITGRIVNSLVGSPPKLKVLANISSPDVLLDINSNVFLRAEKIRIEGRDFDVTLLQDKEMAISSFVGSIEFSGGNITLIGTLTEYTTDDVQIQWRKQKDAVIVIENGTVFIENALIKRFSHHAIGVLRLGDKVNMELKDDNLVLSTYYGPVKYDGADKGMFYFNGTLDSFLVTSPEHSFSAS